MASTSAGAIDGVGTEPTGLTSGLRLASPTTALAIGGIELLLLILAAPLALLGHQFNISGWVATALITFPFACVGLLVAYRRPALRMGWLMLGVGGLWALASLCSSYVVLAYRVDPGRLPLGGVAVVLNPSFAPLAVLLALGIFLYPDGHGPSRRWRWPLRVLLALTAASTVGAMAIGADAVITGTAQIQSDGSLGQLNGAGGGLGLVAWGVVTELTLVTLLLMLGVWFVSQLIGYRRLSGVRRAQQKWIIIGAAISVIALFELLFGWGSTLINDAVIISVVALPVAMGIGILRYRLYEIDRLVSRTLSYAILTALLVGTFVGLVALTTEVLPFSSTAGVAASTLAAAALFNPVRKRVQRIVDRRFNRASYDAEETVAAFASRLRDAVDLDTIQSELLQVVQQAVEPTHATIWVRRTGGQAGAARARD